MFRTGAKIHEGSWGLIKCSGLHNSSIHNNLAGKVNGPKSWYRVGEHNKFDTPEKQKLKLLTSKPFLQTGWEKPPFLLTQSITARAMRMLKVRSAKWILFGQ